MSDDPTRPARLTALLLLRDTALIRLHEAETALREFPPSPEWDPYRFTCRGCREPIEPADLRIVHRWRSLTGCESLALPILCPTCRELMRQDEIAALQQAARKRRPSYYPPVPADAVTADTQMAPVVRGQGAADKSEFVTPPLAETLRQAIKSQLAKDPELAQSLREQAFVRGRSMGTHAAMAAYAHLMRVPGVQERMKRKGMPQESAEAEIANDASIRDVRNCMEEQGV